MSDAREVSTSPPAGARRRVVLFADLVESVRLYQQHESLTIQRWRAFVAAVRETVPPRHGGRVVRTVGDGLLMEFGTAGGAVAAAFELHQQLRGTDADGPAEAAMWLRIGAHVAEVVADEQDLWGSGVNLAARLCSLARPGQTVVSSELRQGLVDGLQADVEDLGPRYLKHIAEPVRAWALHPPGPRQRAEFSRPEDLRPAIAVVPFVAVPADPDHDALGHAMADDVIASLARHPDLRVISRMSTAAVRELPASPEQLRQTLGASFLLSGRFYVRGSRVRLAAELCELRQGEVLWSGSASADVNALFEGQDHIVPHLVSQVAQQVLAHELTRVRSLPMDTLAAYSLLLGANGLLHSLVPADFRRAREVLQHLAERHPRQAAPHALLSGWHVFRMLQGWTENAAEDGRHALAEAQQALDLDPTQPGALVADGVARVFAERDFEAAQRRFREALVHDPQHASAWAHLSETQSQMGEAEAGLASANKAIELSPLDPQRFVFESFAARAAYMAGQFEQAAQHAQASVRLHAMHAPAHRMLIVALWLAGHPHAAREALAHYQRVFPGATVGSAPAAARRTAESPFAQALRSAGLPP
ncbi:MAG: hypothetical protein IV093_21540 [Rubrivivax sp.]|nr:hypothetical protein [Rubrivivax sp.]